VKTTIDIEKLVQWAMRDELPKGRRVAVDAGALVAGCRPQYRPFARSLNRPMIERDGDEMGFVPGEPSDDALAVAAAIDDLDTEARFADRVEVLPLFGDFAGIAGDALDAVMCASFNPQALVVACGAQGVRPKWKFETPKARQRFSPTATKPRPLVYGIDADGDLVEMKKNRGRAFKRDGEYRLAMSPRSPLEWCSPTPLTIADARAEYVAWHAALDTLAHDLAGKLRNFEVTPPAAPFMPWLDRAALVSRLIFRDAFARYASHGLPLAPKRKAPGKPTESQIEAETVAAYNRASREKMKKTRAA
jgi:hypothetical protein